MQVSETKQYSNGVSEKGTAGRLLFFQPKLTVNQPGDEYEQEADAMANTVMRMPANEQPFFSPKPVSVLGLQRKCQHCEEDKLHRKETSNAVTVADQSHENYIGSLNGKGKSLSPEERGFFEPRFGYDFSNVQLHTNSEASQSAESINALAYTHGNNIVFGANQYQPDTDTGKKLMAHELTHVMQQSNVSNKATLNAATIQKQELLPLPEGATLPEGMPWEMPEIGPEIDPEIEIEPEIEPEVEPDVDPDVEPDVEPNVEPDLGPETEQNLNPEPNPDLGPEPIPPLWPEPQPDDSDKEKNKCGSPKMPLTFVAFSPGPQGQAGTVIAQPLTKCPGNTTGSMADWRVYPQQFKCIKKLGLGRFWLPVHMLHGMTPRPRTIFRNLHGPGNDARNIIIAHTSINRQMNAQVEGQALTRVYDLGQVLWYESRVDSYVTGAEFFTQSITINYGLMDMSTNTRGTRLGGGTFTSPAIPPNCPVSLGAAAAPIPLLPPAMADFNSTISLCYRVLTGNVHTVKDGGLRITIRASRPPGCRKDNYFVTLKKKNLIFDDEISTSSIPQDNTVTLTWKYLESGEYYLQIWVPAEAAPNCCLKGTVAFFMFSAPRPKRTRVPTIA